MSMVLELCGVRAGYGSSEVLHGVDLRVPTGSAVALLGANGAGKTTSLRTVAGLTPTRSGRILYRGEPVERRSAHQRARAGIALVPEGRGIFRELSVRENLLIQVGGRQAVDALDKAVTVFPKLGQRLSQQAGTLSGGEQQMLALAGALVTDAPLVLADELSVGLAPIIVDEIFVALEALRAEGRSMLIVEQYVDRVMGLADYVYILHKGTVVFVGEPARCAAADIFERYLGSVA
jgi:branched-chain amino acid transport system ATP-binding protein